MPKIERKIFIRKKADSTRMKDELANLTFHMANSIDEKLNCFEEKIRRIMDSCIPSKLTSSQNYRGSTANTDVLLKGNKGQVTEQKNLVNKMTGAGFVKLHRKCRRVIKRQGTSIFLATLEQLLK